MSATCASPANTRHNANADCRPSHLVQFAYMGAAFMERRYGVERPFRGRHPRAGRDEKLPLGLSFGDQHAVEADVVDIHAVRQVAACVVAAEGEHVAITVARHA